MTLYPAPFLDGWVVSRMDERRQPRTVARGFSSKEAAEAWIDGYLEGSTPDLIEETADKLRDIVEVLELAREPA